MDAARIADKYIGRDGGPPFSTGPGPRAMGQPKQTAETILTLASFIAWHDKGAMWGGYRKEEAFAALCRLTGLPEAMLLRIARGELTKGDAPVGRDARGKFDDIPF